MNITMRTRNERVLENRLRVAAVTADARVAGVIHLYGEILRQRVKQHASGRPGPNVITGEYRNSIQVSYTQRAGGVTATVYSPLPFSRRLEYGFIGTDSAGRAFAQVPRPHFAPAMRELREEFIAALGAVVSR